VEKTVPFLEKKTIANGINQKVVEGNECNDGDVAGTNVRYLSLISQFRLSFAEIQ